MRPYAIATCVAFLLAGCLAAPSPDAAPGPAAPADLLASPLLDEHDHADPALHALQTASFAKLGHHALGENASSALGSYGELDVQGDFAFVAVTGDAGEVPGFIVVDLTARDAPVPVSFTATPPTRVADVKATADAATLFVGAQTITPETRHWSPGGAREAVELAAQNGILAFDVSDKTAPVFLTATIVDTGCHMLAVKEIAGSTVVFCAGATVRVFEWSGDALVPLAEYHPADPTDNDELGSQETPEGIVFGGVFQSIPHDMTVQDDPLTGTPVLLVSYWDFGLRFVDVSNPRLPTELGAWTGDGSTAWVGNVHTALATTLDGATRLVLAVPEAPDDVPSALWVVDATDWTSPAFVSEWKAPGDHPSEGFRFSTHNFQVVEGRVYLAFYHAGVWVLDLAPAASGGAPAPLAYYLPHESVDVATEDPARVNAPDVWDVVVKDGYVYALDIDQGLFALHYAPDALGDATLTSFA